MKPSEFAPTTPEAAYAQVEHIVRRFKALPAAARRDY
jgi:hypothetical protein